MEEAAAEAPVFHIEPHGNLGNRMIQLMVAMKFASLVPGCRISNVALPEWGITYPSVETAGQEIRITSLHRIDMEALAARMKTGEFRRLTYSGYGQRMENFLSVDVYRDTFRLPTKEALGFDERHLVCPVRAGDVVQGAYPEYVLTPVEFYAELSAATGLRLVFMGQTAPNLYTDRLRHAFPDALFLPSRGVSSDFETIRQSKNIVVCVSTFVWLAAWLSHAGKIFMAANGLFNPMQYSEGMLLPFGDPRYEFYLFHVNLAVPLSQHSRVHARIAPWWRLMRPDLLARHVEEAPRVPCTLEVMMPLFDPAFYLAEYPGVGEAMGFTYDNARFHYQHHGIHERRLPFRIDPYWYAEQYPLAAFEVGQGSIVTSRIILRQSDINAATALIPKQVSKSFELGPMVNLPNRRTSITLLLLSAASFVLTGLALIMSAALNTDKLASVLLSYNPRYALAMDGLHILEDFKYPVPVEPGKTEDAGVLNITDPSWGVILDFIQSEAAIRKSERNMPPFPETPTSPVPAAPAPVTGRTPPPNAGAPSSPTTTAMPPTTPAIITKSDFERAKTIVAIRLDIARAGDQPLAPPYRLILVSPWIGPAFKAYRVYEFLSFEEFRLDLKHMLLDEMESFSLWVAVIGFGCTAVLEGLRRFRSSAERRGLVSDVVEEVTATLAEKRLPPGPQDAG